MSRASPATGVAVRSSPRSRSRPIRSTPDLIKRDFTAPAPNLRYVGDITYLPLADGSNLYLATVIDCYSRRLVGWSIADHMRTDLVTDALKAAHAARGSLSGAVFHSDHGSVYTSKVYARLCEALGVTQSTGAVGTSADNSLAEAFNATLKREILQDFTAWPDQATRRRPSLPLADPLQHAPPALLVPLPVPDHLRNHHRRYAPVSGVIPPRVQEPVTRPGRLRGHPELVAGRCSVC